MPRLTPVPAFWRRKLTEWFTPPLDETTPTAPASMAATPGTKLAWSPVRGTKNPDVLGPSNLMPVSLSTFSISRWCSEPASPASAKPPAQTSAACTPASAADRSDVAVALAGTHRIARSSAPSSARAASPIESYIPSPRGLTSAIGAS